MFLRIEDKDTKIQYPFLLELDGEYIQFCFSEPSLVRAMQEWVGEQFYWTIADFGYYIPEPVFNKFDIQTMEFGRHNKNRGDATWQRNENL